MSKALKAYEEKFSKIPKDAATLVAFSKKTKGLKECSDGQAKKAIAAAKKEREAAAAAAAAAKETKGKKKGKKGKGKKEKEKEPEPEPEPEPAPKKKKEKVSTKYKLGNELLLSKDRMGILRYAGEIPELGAGIWYGVELTDGSVGQTNGNVKGKTYFECKDGLKRALFVPLHKIRRRMNSRDHTRHESLTSLQQLAHTDKDDDEAADAPAAKDSPAQSKGDDSKDDSAGGTEEPAEESGEDTDAATKEEEEPASKPSGRRGSVVKPTEGGFQTILQFILDQPEATRREFLDIYTNPALNPLFTEAFKQIKDMDSEKQAGVWDLLVKRWQRYLK